jgi:hypothetical protein
MAGGRGASCFAAGGGADAAGGGGGTSEVAAGGGGGVGGGGVTKFWAIAGINHATAKTAAATGVGQRFLTRLCRKTPPQDVYCS